MTSACLHSWSVNESDKLNAAYLIGVFKINTTFNGHISKSIIMNLKKVSPVRSSILFFAIMEAIIKFLKIKNRKRKSIKIQVKKN